MTTTLNDLKLYTTYPHPCSYLQGRQATTLFIDPRADVTSDIYNKLSQVGFRRSGLHLYRPNCGGCQACVSARVPVRSFQPRRSQRRVLRRNEDLVAGELEHIDRKDCFGLYCRYINARHRDGDMYPPSRMQYEAFLGPAWGVTRYFCLRLEGRLVGVAVTDELEDGLAAIYTFYDPALEGRSLGSYFLLWQIETTRALGLDYLYLGYWIKNCRKMAYKTQYRPLEMLIDGKWRTVR